MSAINVIVQASAVHVLTDGAGYSDAGVFEVSSSKVWPLPQLQAVLAVRGPGLFPIFAGAVAASTARNYDGLKAGIAGSIRLALAGFQEIAKRCEHGGDFDLVVAGISETSGPDSYILTNHRRYPEVAPFTVVNLGPVSCMPADGSFHRALVAALPPGAAADDLDPARDGLRILELQRKIGFPIRDGGAATMVGAFAQLTTITVDAITTRILKRWPDKIGRKLAAADEAWAEAEEFVR